MKELITVKLSFGEITGGDEVLNYIARALYDSHCRMLEEGFAIDGVTLCGDDANAIHKALSSLGYYDNL